MTGPEQPPAPLRIVVADDQASVRQGLVVLLDLLPNITVVASATNGEEAIQAVSDTRPDAILLDLHMPVLDGIETTRQLTRTHPEVAVVVLTTYDDDTSVLAALRAGAAGYLTKDADRADIARALRGATGGGLSILNPSALAALLATAVPRPERAPRLTLPDTLPDGLTRREGEILALIADGMTNPEIAAHLYLSLHTIKSHINRIFAKTGASDRSTAIDYARRVLGAVSER